jgi:hypothetical protein
MQIAIIQTEAADYVNIYICVILKTFGHDCTWNSIPHQVTDASSRIRYYKTDKNTPYGTAGTVKQHKQAQTHAYTHNNIGTIHTHIDFVLLICGGIGA